MDLHHISTCLTPQSPDEVRTWTPGQAWLAGGTWLFSEPQPDLHTLVDMRQFAWPALQVSEEDGLEIAATCTIAALHALAPSAPDAWRAASLIQPCCEALQSSFKIWNEATVGGNLCLGLPAGGLVSLAVALEGVCIVWGREGPPRAVLAADFVTGIRQTALAPGDLLRSIHLPGWALRKQPAFRRFSQTQEGRSSVLLIGTRCPGTGEILLTITAATTRPVQIRFATAPPTHLLQAHLDADVPSSLYFNDPHGTADHRRHLTRYFATQIIDELA
jgi:CO/xanthine dehydrogenase FAD-binding subunit